MRRTHLFLMAALGAGIAAAWKPTRARAPSRDLIYPVARSTIVFSHAKHQARGASCISCHAEAAISNKVADRLVPTGKTCDRCHGAQHPEPPAVAALGPSCKLCHGDAIPAPAAWPNAQLSAFSHKKHGQMGLSCQRCHGDLQRTDLATEKDLPSMALCLTCHTPNSKSALAAPKLSDCKSCHPTEASGRLKTDFADGALRPEHIGAAIAHDADFGRNHATVARAQGQTCTTCHTAESCTDCHAGRTRQREVHPGDFLRTHGVEARLGAQTCTNCHRTESFCAPCHAATGVASSSPSATRASGKMHPSKETFMTGRGPESHAVQAAQNLASCTSCHTPSDCTSCHASRGIGGGVNPHGADFSSRCKSLLRANRSACTSCHADGDTKLGMCK